MNGRCKDCKYWERCYDHGEPERMGSCEVDYYAPTKVRVGGNGILLTDEEFGCILFEAKVDDERE